MYQVKTCGSLQEKTPYMPDYKLVAYPQAPPYIPRLPGVVPVLLRIDGVWDYNGFFPCDFSP